MKRALIIVAMLTMAIVLTVSTALADVILFPVLTTNPNNVSTLISVINTSVSTSTANQLHYRYFSKAASASLTTSCEEYDFYRPTTQNDIVTFDATGTLAGVSGGGTAMFADTTSYATGAYAPYFTLVHSTQPRRAFLLVAHAIIDTDVTTDYSMITLDGEAAIIDVVNGAAWGYRAVQNVSGYDFTNPHESFNGTDTQIVAIYPPSQYTTRFFVTPLDADQDSVGLGGGTISIGIRLANAAGNYGMYDRNENPVSGGTNVRVRCVGAVDLSSFVGSSIMTVLNTQGGWGLLDIIATDTVDLSTYTMLYKLEYGNALTGVTGMVNTANQIRTAR